MSSISPAISAAILPPTISPAISTVNKCGSHEFKHMDGLSYLRSNVANNSVDLVLTDPPYMISKKSGMNAHYNSVKQNEENKVSYVKKETDWLEYKVNHQITDDTNKQKYLKYGSIYGKKYCIQTHYGDWDTSFTTDILEEYIAQFYKKLKNGGTLIIFFDLWKITVLKEILVKCKFKQIRFIEWIKTNPQPRNTKINYLTNCREIALTGVKQSKPTFNSSQDNGIYYFPLQSHHRYHPAQKSLKLFKELITKHSNPHDVVLDTFCGSGTTLLACRSTDRQFKGCEVSKKYYDIVMSIIK